MEGRGPYRIYDPGGSTPLGEVSAAFERLVEENTRLKGKIQGIKMLGKADHDPSHIGPLPAACNASPLTKAARYLCPSRCCPCDPELGPGICVQFCSLVMASPALTSPIPKGIPEGPGGQHEWEEKRKAQFVDLEPEWSPVGKMKHASSLHRAVPEPGAWMPGQSRAGPELSASGPLALFLLLLLKLFPTVQPSPPPSLPTLTTALHASSWCRAFTDSLPLLTLCLEVTFFVFSLRVEGLAPWLSKHFPLLGRAHLSWWWVVVGVD